MVMKSILLVATLTLATLTTGMGPLVAQTTTQNEDGTVTIRINSDLVRAKNLARQAAEKANGGLENYRAENSMHGPIAQAPYVDNGNGSWTFTFKGRKADSTEFTMESVVTVVKEGWQVTVNYNGPVRSTNPSGM
ncbi:MAG: hypothetical protein KME16_14695 [Scytolyngbya sp. HA4215-MV1]|nr:hypothetical protein [Scytolyngbya sp. HA4215-MV1]